MDYISIYSVEKALNVWKVHIGVSSNHLQSHHLFIA